MSAFPALSPQRYTQRVVQELQESFIFQVKQSAWMDDTTAKRAVNKVRKFFFLPAFLANTVRGTTFGTW